MDEPASALDPIATTRIEDLMHELKREYTIVVVTHNMQQAARVMDMTAFFSVTRGGEGQRTASSSSTTRPRRSSRSPPTSDRGLRDRPVRLGNPDERSGERRLWWRNATHVLPGGPRPPGSNLQEESEPFSDRSGLAERARAAGRRVCRRGDRVRRRGRRALPRSARESSSCSPGRRPSRSICGSCSPCCTSTWVSSAWPTSA